MAYATTPRRHVGRTPSAPARKMGTWKMAYADFLTALMAFFLLMWMISGVSKEDRSEVANYFSHAKPQTATTIQLPEQTERDRLFSALSLDPALQKMGDSLILTKDPEGVRIDLVDRPGRPLFESGIATLTQSGEELVLAAGQSLALLTASISIEGHTDAFASELADYSNWELSSDRANAARRGLMDAGLEPTRIQAVTGLSDTKPLLPGQPHLPVNRRVSILVHSGG